MQPYFAYGSNMDSGQRAVRCPGAERVGVAVLRDYRVLINAQGVGTVIPAKRESVFGLLWRLSEKNVEALDSYEGVASGHYHREYVTVDSAGDQIQALVYVATNVAPGKPRPGYLEGVLKAATDVGLPETYIAQLSNMARDSHHVR
jgi:gamma-glutamylcyclotransferase (GGCT)/AIG2-like uncharacterized protein YtfP